MGDPIDDMIQQILAEGENSEEQAPPEAAAPPPVITQRPAGVSDWAWNQYLAAVRDYDEVWNDLKRSEGFGLSDPVLQTRANNATSLLAKAKATVDGEIESSTKKTSASAWSAGSTSSPYLMRQNADGGLEQMPNPNYTPPKGPQPAQLAPLYPWEAEEGELRTKKLKMELSGELTPWQKIEWDYKKQQDELSRQQQDRAEQLARQQQSWREASDLITSNLQAAPMAQIPGQTHFLGYEPGGAWQTLAAKLKIPFDAEKFRAPLINPWQQAANRIQR